MLITATILQEEIIEIEIVSYFKNGYLFFFILFTLTWIFLYKFVSLWVRNSWMNLFNKDTFVETRSVSPFFHI